MSDLSPWDGICVPGSDFNVRQVAAATAVPCYWGRDAGGSCLFIVDLQGDHTNQFRKEVVTVSGINVDLRAGTLGRQRLIFVLERQVDRDLFEGLCRTLISSLVNAGDSASSLAVSMAHMRRWKTFLAGRSQNLSVREIQGLFAEIVFLTELIDRRMSSSAAVEAWLGPERSHQDFIFGNTAVEVKSLSGAERSRVRISSEDQLEALNDALFLRVYRLSSLTDAAGARSLNEIVAEVRARVVEADALEAFDKKLLAYGYAPVPYYDEPRFVVRDVRSYRVGDTFPRLMRSRIPSGVVNVTYEIGLEAIAPYECDERAVFRED